MLYVWETSCICFRLSVQKCSCLDKLSLLINKYDRSAVFSLLILCEPYLPSLGEVCCGNSPGSWAQGDAECCSGCDKPTSWRKHLSLTQLHFLALTITFLLKKSLFAFLLSPLNCGIVWMAWNTCPSPFSVDLMNLSENNAAQNISLHLISYLPHWLFGPDSVTMSSC